MTYQDRSLEIAQNAFEWFVTTEVTQSKAQSMEYLMNIAEAMFELGKKDGRSEELKEVLSKLGAK